MVDRLTQIDETATSDFHPLDGSSRKLPTIPRLVDVLDLPTAATSAAATAHAARRTLKTLAASEHVRVSRLSPRVDA